MSILENSYEILKQVRLGLDEYSEGKVQGTDTAGRYNNDYLMDQINKSGRWLFALLLRRMKHEFLEEASLTAVDSVFTLPWDFGSLLYFKDEDGHKVHPIQVSQLKLTNATGSDRLYYRKGNTLVLDKTGQTPTYTFYYLKKYRDVHCGQAASGSAAGFLNMSADAKPTNEYYEGMSVESIDEDWAYQITDYSILGANKTATLSNALAACAEDDWYGIVPDLPEPFLYLLAPRTVLNVRLYFPKTKKRPTATELREFNGMLSDTMRSFAGSAEDVDVDDIWCDYSPRGGLFGGIVND